MSLRCLIIDDNASFLNAARALLEGQGVTVVGVATTASEGLQRGKELRPDVILVDVDLGDESGFSLARQLSNGAARAPSNNGGEAEDPGPQLSFVDLFTDFSE